MRRRQKQQGLASIVVVFILVIVLSLISIGFTKIIERSTQSSVNSQLAAAATAAAQSGISEVSSKISGLNLSATDCNASLNGTGDPQHLKKSLGPNTSLTCVLVDKSPPTLQYQNLPPNKSQIVKLQPIASQNPISQLMFSWSSSDRSKTKAVTSGQSLYDQTYWASNNYLPMLQISLFPIFSGDTDLNQTNSNAQTYFLYPNSGTSNQTVTTSNYTPSGQPISVLCGAKTLPTGVNGFAGSTDNYDCSAIISMNGSGFPGAPTAIYAQMMPIYGQSNVEIRANSGANNVTYFQNAQTSIDVTANSGGASKRLLARVDSSNGTSVNASSDAAPVDALRSAGTLCKRLIVDPAANPQVHVDNNSQTDCAAPVVAFNQPTATLSVSTNTVVAGGSVSRSWSSTNATSCNISGDTGSPTINGNPVGLSGGPVSATYTTSATIVLTCIDGQGHSGTDSKTITVLQTPALSFSASPTTVAPGGASTLTWGESGGGFTFNWCYGTSVLVSNGSPSGIWAGGTTNVTYPASPNSNPQIKSTSAIISDTKYTLYCGNNSNGYQSPPISVTVTVVAPKVSLTVNFSGTGSGSVTSNDFPQTINCTATCSNSYNPGTSLILTATAAAGSTFAGWSGACTNATGTCTVTLNSNTSVTATFNATPPPTAFELDIYIKSNNGGVLSSDNVKTTIADTKGKTKCRAGDSQPCKFYYNPGTAVPLTADTGSPDTFAGHAGKPTNVGCTSGGTSNPCTLTMPTSLANCWNQANSPCVKANFLFNGSIVSSSSSPGPGGGSCGNPVCLVVPRWDVGNMVYYDANHTQDVSSCKSYPGVPDRTDHVWYVCGIGIDVQYSDGHQPTNSIACSLLVNGSNVGNFQNGINGLPGSPLGDYATGNANSFWTLGWPSIYAGLSNQAQGPPAGYQGTFDSSVAANDSAYETVGFHCWDTANSSYGTFDCAVNVNPLYYGGFTPGATQPPSYPPNYTGAPYDNSSASCPHFGTWN